MFGIKKLSAIAVTKEQLKDIRIYGFINLACGIVIGLLIMALFR